MEPFRGILLLIGLILIFAIFCHSRGWYPKPSKWFARKAEGETGDGAEAREPPLLKNPEPAVSKPETPPLRPGSKVVTVRIMPQQGSAFPAEELILALRSAGLCHGQFGIFHAHDDADDRIRFSVASLIEPGSFDLSNLKESEYLGISMFAVLPAPEDGLQLFDDMISKAREITKAIDGCLVDEQGGAFSLQRERYMREELIDYLRRHENESIGYTAGE